jgi:hypothetical protein
MQSLTPTNTTRIVRETFIDMALYLDCLFFLHGVNDILVEDIVHCMEEGYANAVKNLKKISSTPPPSSSTSTADRLISSRC